jgi:diguanylate cyclase
MHIAQTAASRRPDQDVTMTQHDHQPRLRRAAWLARGQAVIVLACVVGYALDVSKGISALCFLTTGIITCLAMVVGPRLHHPSDTGTWRRFQVACVLLAVGPAVRPSVKGADGWLLALPDMFLIPGYLLFLAALWRLLRGRGAFDGGALLDVGVVALGATLLALSYLVVPLIRSGHLPIGIAVLNSAYPVFDVAMLALMVMLWFTARDRSPALVLLSAAFALFLVGDLGYDLLARDGVLVAPVGYDIPYFVSFGLLGQVPLQRSMTTLGFPRTQRIQPWSWQRLIILVPAFLVPAWLILADADLPARVRFVQAVGAVLLVVAVLARASRAVADQAESRRTFQELATHDTLTGLANRVALHEYLEESISQGLKMNVLFLDLDGFKMVNDSWGHAVGDELLVQVAERMKRRLPPGALLARTGGDEFVVVTAVRESDPDGLVFAEQVIAELSQPFSLSPGEVVVTPSVGVTSSVGRQSNADSLVREADTAMYRAKESGRARAVVYDESMGALVRERVLLDRALRHALLGAELSVVYQPVVELATGRLLGFEALARWDRPGQGPCPPDVFIPAAEENGLIVPIGDFVLGKALDELRRWRRDTPSDISVNINVSGRQLLDPTFADRVLRALEQRHLPAQALRLEITESTLVSDQPVAVDALRDLETAGVSLSVDDFGTGYSSLSYLSRLRVHEVKIDRSFVTDVATRSEDRAIVRATVAMADALGLTVVAEGIETEEQRDALVGLQISRGQGWFFGRPVQADEAARLVRCPSVAPAVPPRL